MSHKVLLFTGRDGYRYYYDQQLEADEAELNELRKFIGMSPKQQQTFLQCSNDPVLHLQKIAYRTNRVFERIYQSITRQAF